MSTYVAKLDTPHPLTAHFRYYFGARSDQVQQLHDAIQDLTDEQRASMHAVSDDTRALCEPILQLGNYSLDEYVNKPTLHEKKRDGMPSAVLS